MTTEFSIDPETINRYVAEKIAESAIGEALKKAIDEQVTTLARSYDNPMKAIVANELAAAAREYLQTPEVKERLEEAVRNNLTDEVLEGIITRVVAEGYRR